MYRFSWPLLLLVGGQLVGCKGPQAADTRTRMPPSLSLEKAVDGLGAPINLVSDGDGGTYVVDQVGLVYDLAGPIAPASAFADLRDRVVPIGPDDPRGLAGFAFHPDYPVDPRVFAWYATPGSGLPTGYDHANRLSSFTVVDGQVDLASEEVLLALPNPGRDHDGAGPVFGPNGLLYLAIGDGGGAGDVGLGHPAGGNGQDPHTLLGAVLRIDVDSGIPYSIPPDNPFANGGGAPEVYAYGFRDPTGIVFDPRTGELYLSDRGQDLLDEVDVVHAGGNYGWNLREGTVCFDPQRPDVPPPTCPDSGLDGSPLVAPVLSFPRPGGHIVGDGDAGDGVAGEGVVAGQPVRADSLPRLEGHFLFGARSQGAPERDGVLFLGDRAPEGWSSERIELVDPPASGLGALLQGVAADGAGELYVLTTDRDGATGTGGAILHVLPGEE